MMWSPTMKDPNGAGISSFIFLLSISIQWFAIRLNFHGVDRYQWLVKIISIKNIAVVECHCIGIDPERKSASP